MVLSDPYPADSEQFMLIEELYKQVEKLQEQQEAGIHNEVMIKFLDEQVKKLQSDVEKLKDSNREIHYKNGSNWKNGRDCNSPIDDRQPGNQGTQNTALDVCLPEG